MSDPLATCQSFDQGSIIMENSLINKSTFNVLYTGMN